MFISRWYAEAELRVTIGCVEPHPALGWSGGAKLVVPGLAGIETIAANHRPGHLARGILAPDDNASAVTSRRRCGGSASITSSTW